MNTNYISDYLRTFRLYKGLSVTELGRATGIRRETVRNFEAGVSFTLPTLDSITKYFGLLPSTVFEFMEICELNGLESAYMSEAPYLWGYRKPLKRLKIE